MFDDQIFQDSDILDKKTDQVNRRDVLKMGLAGTLAAMAPILPAQHAQAASNYSSWNVAFRHSHTGESFSGVYRVGDKYLPEAFEKLNHFMRDFRTGDVFPMDPRILDLLHIIHAKTGSNEPFQVLSGYRSPKTNNMLRRTGSGVAKNSYHMYGQAIDIRLPGFSTRKLASLAKSLRAGGVGYYAKSGFVHIDTGKVRSW